MKLVWIWVVVQVKDGMLDFVETVLFGPRVVGWLACV